MLLRARYPIGLNSVQAPDGWLVGINHGEWGGNIIWCSKDGARSYEVSEDTVLGFLAVDGRIYCVEGCYSGTLREISKNSVSGKWSSVELARFDVAPRAMTRDSDGRLLIASGNGIYRYSPRSRQLIRQYSANWHGLYLSSIVLDEAGVAYVAMRQGVARLLLTDTPVKEEWLVPSLDQMRRDDARAYRPPR